MMYLLELYHGVQLWVIDFNMRDLVIQAADEYHFLKLNYCIAGRCEVQLPNHRYVYMNSGLLSADLNPPVGRLSLPSGEYVGLECVINLAEVQKSPPAAWAECGINFMEAQRLLSGAQGSYLAQVQPEWDQLARELAEQVRQAKLPLEDYRFLFLRLLWMLKAGKKEEASSYPAFLTPGQRAVAIRVEAQLTKNLRNRYTIAQLAAQEGISQASLKKHFAQVFGKPISAYLKEQRVEKAKALLAASMMSIADVASEVGYENQGKFGVMFRQATGVTPLEYRRLHHIQIKRGEK